LTHPPPPHSHTLSLHDALPIYTVDTLSRAPRLQSERSQQDQRAVQSAEFRNTCFALLLRVAGVGQPAQQPDVAQFLQFELRDSRSEEHTSELQSRVDLVCRLLL